MSDNYDPTVKVLPVNEAGEILTKLRLMFGVKAQIQESDVRLESLLTASSVQHVYNMQGDGTAQRELEVFINRNDLVVFYELKVAVNKIVDTVDGNNGNSIDYTYNDLTAFPGPAVGTSQTEAGCLQAIWAGTISIKSNTYEVLNKMVLRRFRVVNQTQLSVTTQAQLDESGFVKINQPYILSGRDNNEMAFAPAQGADVSQIGGAAGTTNNLVFHAKTFSVRNGAQALTNTEMKDYQNKSTADRWEEGTSCGALV